jgi:four helix bundle protein
VKYERFEDLPVWNAANRMAHGVFDLVRDRGCGALGDLRDQLQRASLSIGNNIAEGFERGTKNELLSFLFIARGSAGEVRSVLRFADERAEVKHLKPQIARLIGEAESISRQLAAWAASLQNCDIPGQRHLNDQSLTEYRQRKRSEQFVRKLQSMTPHIPRPPSGTSSEP